MLDRLPEIGVRHVDWVLFSHHHREQDLGAPRLRGTGTRIAAPEAEQALFEQPTDFRRMQVRLGDPHTVHGASDVRAPIQPIPLDRTLADREIFTWRGHEFECLATSGNRPGARTYRLRLIDHWLAFSGDVMLDGARLHTWFDTEWDYGFAAGNQALRQTVARLQDIEVDFWLPLHGPVVRDPRAQFEQFAAKLERLERLYVRGCEVEGGSAAYQDKVFTATVVSNLWQVTPSIFKFKRPQLLGQLRHSQMTLGR